ncbi:venom serine carboxypeptidase [Halyomorpha halys]|uniref:venom serine carboxypeptidase n=1 Tax=Halyomorpha halys TaxID=286706 RepID=UPI0006D4DBEB|nr:venom serine carboxypeptidase-like [Halyomorpha halys]KAE8573640.1 Putative retinoid-inducible serine carboxypeptidase [Halyomorpha halys]
MRQIQYLFIFCLLGYITCFRRTSPHFQSVPNSEAAGEVLFLTPYIEAGNISEGQSAAEVHLPGINLTSYAGYFTVNKNYNSNLFLWYIQAKIDPENAPVVLWLQGGPGSSSLFGLFCENGPITPDKNGKMEYAKHAWSKAFNMIYIDNPVGTGFSFTEDEQGYPNNQVDVGKDLYSALDQFFILFPGLRDNDFFVTGESYAGKYVPAVSFAIHTANQNSTRQINLKGLAIGDGWTDPENMLVYGDYLYEIGLIDENARDVFRKKENETRWFIQNGDYSSATEVIDSLILTIYTPYPSYFTNITGFQAYYNYLNTDDGSESCNYYTFLLSDEIRNSIHVGNMTYQGGDTSAKHLFDDIAKSVKPWVEVLLDNYRVLFYNGQLDIICAYPLTVSLLNNLSWSGSDLYKVTPRKKWFVGGELAGYTKRVRGFTEVLVRNAGHMVPSDQPKYSFELLSRFVFNRPF